MTVPPIPGFAIPISGGEGDGSTFFLCENFVAANAFDVLTRALPVGEGEMRAFFYVTMLGSKSGGEGGGVTLVIPFEMMMEMLRQVRPMLMRVPMELRGTGPFPGGSQVDPFQGWLE